ncbi:Ppx/GppA phosphatase family protein [Aurantimonas marianensis]|uniref:Ppx/GppA family phosphatase n=1 Tax=Aurantimonas marianensis TaxID=2920428 RepID=A0A9X2HAQ2_9HYPH|nr:Ppx/GppA family phosphatase [Aurantimonas marianensis]
MSDHDIGGGNHPSSELNGVFHPGSSAPSPHGAGEGGQSLTKRQRRRRRKTAAKNAALPDAAAKTAKDDDRSAGRAELRGARKPRRRRPRSRAAMPAAAAPDAVAAASDGARGAAALARAEATPGRCSAGGSAPARAVRPAPSAHRPPAYAALDLGTNNCRLLIAIPTRPGQFRVIDAFSRIVRLGEGLSRTGSLSRGAMDRAITALGICAQKLAARDVGNMRLIATEACRQAANGAEFIEQVARQTGLELEIVTRETEARLAVSGCGSLIDRSAKGAVLFDIGGGSSEIALLDLRGGYTRRLASRIVAWTSLPVGVVTLAERHGGRDITPELFEQMVVETVAMIHRFPERDRLGSVVGGDRFHLLGTSGTVTTLAGVHLNLERYDRRQVDGLWLADREADELVARIAGWSFDERVANPCIGSDRADLVLAGCAILQAIRRVWPARTLRVADRGLREGLLTEMMVADGVWRRNEPTRKTGG